MFMIKYANFYSRDGGLCFRQEHMPYFRMRTAKEILTQNSPESVDTTVRELEENLKEGIATDSPSSTNLAHAKVVGIACDVCDPNDVQKLANVAGTELGSIEIWLSQKEINLEKLQELRVQGCLMEEVCVPRLGRCR